jgi:preprotein translocase subunit YajC
MGTEMVLAATTKSSSSATSLILVFVVLALVMLFMFRSTRRRQQNAQNVRNQVVNGSKIRTIHGIFGTVVDSDDRNVMVEVSPGVQVKMMRQAIGQVLPDDEPDGILHTDTDSSTGWSQDGSSADGASVDHSSDDHSSEDQSSEERSDLSR